jgi:hypothetical protein
MGKTIGKEKCISSPQLIYSVGVGLPQGPGCAGESLGVARNLNKIRAKATLGDLE